MQIGWSRKKTSDWKNNLDDLFDELEDDETDIEKIAQQTYKILFAASKNKAKNLINEYEKEGKPLFIEDKHENKIDYLTEITYNEKLKWLKDFLEKENKEEWLFFLVMASRKCCNKELCQPVILIKKEEKCKLFNGDGENDEEVNDLKEKCELLKLNQKKKAKKV